MDIQTLYDIFQQHPTVTTDSRRCPEGSIFFALKGASFDGNAYAASALEQGCAYAVVDNAAYAADDDRCILVDDVLHTLQQLARLHRRTLGTPVVGITGTNGKTTTKELTAAVLQRRFNLLYTQGNLNNHIGVPLTLLRLTAEHELAVVEMGASHPGDIRELVDIAEPDYGLITNVGKAHLQGFGSFEGVVSTKGELYDYLREHGGTAFVNPHNDILAGMAQGMQTIPYVDGTLTDCNPFLRLTLFGRDVATHLIGAYNMDNVLAAATVGRQFGVGEDDICAALADYVPSNNRSQFVQTADNRLVVDAYNANPTSMMVALQNFRQMAAPHKLCILGDMGELGTASREEHQRIVDYLAGCDFEGVWLVGRNFADARCPASFRHFDDVDAVKTHLTTDKPCGMTILVKGSNSTRLYQLPEAL
ncbi:MAG: UDP-N-acetylmuramoyl-tripeptide--D-alanyl-D-alanine ligase [Prevotellaceae bacterium]|nr:UDP-N-acetylmuramoyl-tripeptide--D-alanyl-D-alanine ligase [Prevotellaceae bacterium]